METLDEQSNRIPNEAIVEMKSMCKWMTFTGVMGIIIGILFLLSLLSNTSTVPNVGLTIVMQLLSLVLAFLLVTKSASFNKYAAMRNEIDLIKALKSTQIYWMATTILMVINILISLTLR